MVKDTQKKKKGHKRYSSLFSVSENEEEEKEDDFSEMDSQRYYEETDNDDFDTDISRARKIALFDV